MMNFDKLNVRERTTEELKVLAEQGDAGAMTELGWRQLHSGDDEESGKAFIVKAAALGNDRAQYVMGTFFSDTPEEKVEWYKKAAAQGNQSALLDLAQFYREGKNVKQDDEEALRLFEAAYKHGSGYAAFIIGKLYKTGECVPQDDKQAIAWFRKAMELSAHSACEQLEVYYRKGIGDIRLEEIVQFHLRCVEHGMASSFKTLGRFYEEGFGVEKNPREALRCYKEYLNSIEARYGLTEEKAVQVELARRYEKGDDVEKNEDEALRLYRMAAGAEIEAARIEKALR